MKKSIFTFAMYKPTSGNEEQLRSILEDHIPTLRKYELIIDHTAYMLQSEDGTIIEVFEWANEKAIEVAHEHPAIRTIWGKMEGICEFPSMRDLPEADQRFPNFSILHTH